MIYNILEVLGVFYIANVWTGWLVIASKKLIEEIDKQ